MDPLPYILKDKSHRLTPLLNNKEKKYNLPCVSTAAFFLILTGIYPKLKGLSYLHFAGAKTEAKQPPSAGPYHAPPQDLGCCQDRWPGGFLLLVSPCNQQRPQAGFRRMPGGAGSGGSLLPVKALLLPTAPSVQQTKRKSSRRTGPGVGLQTPSQPSPSSGPGPRHLWLCPKPAPRRTHSSNGFRCALLACSMMPRKSL